MRTGLDDFHGLLIEINKVAAWVLPVAGVTPVIASLSELNPPWPNKVGLTVATSAVILLALILVFQFLRGKNRKIINRSLTIFMIATITIALLYFSAFIFFVYKTPVTGEAFTKGYQCSAEAIQLYASKCPWLDLDELSGAEYEATRLWTLPSIAITKIALLFLWFSMFATYSLSLASFVCHQALVKSKSKFIDVSKSDLT